jgi:phosphatidylglycerophosphate synthase
MTPWDQRLAVLLAPPIGRLGVSPNAVTTFGLLMGLLAGYLFSTGDQAISNWAALVFVYAVFNDHVDGAVARFTGKSSKFGAMYDHVGSGVSYVAMFVGVGYGLREGEIGVWAVPLGLAAGISVTLIFLVRTWVERVEGRDAIRQPSTLGFEIEDTLYIVGPITWLGVLEPFILLSGIGTPLFLIYVLYDAGRMVKARGSWRA